MRCDIEGNRPKVRLAPLLCFHVHLRLLCSLLQGLESSLSLARYRPIHALRHGKFQLRHGEKSWHYHASLWIECRLR